MEDKKVTLQQPQTAEAIFQKAEAYRRQENYIKAHELYMEAARQNHKEAQLKLGWMYEYGKGVSQDPTEAQRWYNEARINQNIYQSYVIGFTGRTSIYKKRSSNKKKEYVHQNIYYDENYMAIITPSFVANLSNGKSISNNRNAIKQKDNELEKIKNAALQGDVYAQFQLGTMYENGMGVHQDLYKACQWYKKAALQKHVNAQFNLGLLYEKGNGIKQNYREAYEWYRLAAERGNMHAQFHLGNFYTHGTGVEKNEKIAFDWYKRAAKQGHYAAGEAITKYGANKNKKKKMIKGEKPINVSIKDNNHSVKNTEKTVENIGVRLEYNNKKIKDNKNLVGSTNLERNILREKLILALKGDVDSQFEFGVLCERGNGKQRNLNKAYDWYKKAAEQGHLKAKERLKIVELLLKEGNFQTKQKEKKHIK